MGFGKEWSLEFRITDSGFKLGSQFMTETIEYDSEDWHDIDRYGGTLFWPQH